METFPTVAGDVEVLAEVRTSERVLRLEAISVAPATAGAKSAGYTVLRGIMEQITGAAFAQGFDVVEFEGERISGATIGRTARVARRQR